MEQEMFSFLNKVYMLAAVLIFGVLVFFVGEMILQEKAINQQNNYQITVSGEGKVYAKPDVALVNLGVSSEAKTVADATKNNTEKMNLVIVTIKNLNIDEKDIQTTNYNLTPVYENYNVSSPVPMMYPATETAVIKSGTTLTGYKLEQNIQVKIRDFSKVGDVLAKATAAGANLVGDLQFTIDNPQQFKEEARAKAIKQAKENAQNLAKNSGIKLGKLINVYENYIYPMAYNKEWGIGGGVADSAPVPTIQPGQQEINVTINLTYQVK